ncbi:glycosyltransferase involved in cell wall biosynthesis [Natranaerovirga pectinivora]|uniref:Glycosyltransferase involved in cell wall biosynthesis n=1 Tax=Natranaerovirga pectinivora TaxID=682400 RepID=A0A4R3MJ39_9FIRM|nr:glycosyltransferase [Natranaerovirga pectinivora]TCT14033.1 glycosyltransferase involved in cell wall biosynthesis [Natranaerovirga pectinivora]
MISIILPVFNGEKFICNAIQSVLLQTYSKWELIIVDDGSTDQTSSLVKIFSDKRIKYIYQKNQGPASARNQGINIAKGEYIAFIDADDLYLEDKLKEQVEYLRLHPEIDIVYNDIKVVDESLSYLYSLNSEHVYNSKEEFLAMLLFRQIIPLPPSIMLKKSCFEEGIRFNKKYSHGEDYDLTIQLAKKFCFGYLPKTLYIYRRHDNNLTNNHKKQLEAEINVLHCLGYSNIELIVEKSNFPFFDRKLLLAKIYLKLEEVKPAERILLDLYKKNKKHSLINFYLGNCSYQLDDLERAKTFFESAILNECNKAEFYNNLGCVYARLGEMEKAHLLFQKALLKRPEYLDAFYNKEEINNNKKDWKLTKRQLRKNLTKYHIK